MRRTTSSLLAAIVATAGGAAMPAQPGPRVAIALSNEWPTYGHDSGGMRFSPLTQVSPANVAQLKVAWAYHMRPEPPATSDSAESGSAQGRGRGRGGSGLAGSETTPIVADGLMYLSTPYNRVVALDPTS